MKIYHSWSQLWRDKYLLNMVAFSSFMETGMLYFMLLLPELIILAYFLN